jgi:phosphotransferase family enzyme
VTPELPAGELEAVFGSAAPPDEVIDLRGKKFASTLGVWRVAAQGKSLVLKHLALGAGGTRTWPSEPEIDSTHYWRREVEVYERGLSVEVPFRLPAAAVFERADGSVALWLEDVGDPEPWPDEDIVDLARRLAAMPIVDDGPAWLARGWWPRYLDLRAFRFDPELSYWQRRDEIVARIEAQPSVLVHNDFHPGNVFRPGGDPVVIDWAFAGIGVPGSDAGVLAGDFLFDGFYAPEDAQHLIDLIWDAYSGALDPALVPEAEFTYFVGNALRYGWAPAINEHFAAVHAALASAAATRLPSFA